MKPADLLRLRQDHHGLLRPTFRRPEDVVAWFGAVQAQDYLGSLWAIGLRVPGITETEVEAAETRRAIVRLWPMRGTLHFVAADDVRWINRLLAPRVIARNCARWKRDLGIDAALVSRAEALITKGLAGGKRLTREQLYAVLEAHKIPTAKMRGLHILLWLALEGRLCFAGRRGKQQTFALLDEWIPKSRNVERDAALTELARRYFTSHGPATERDFMWWAGLTSKDAKAALAAAAPDLTRECVEGAHHWWRKDTLQAPSPKSPRPQVCLLPAFDEYTVAYRDRANLLGDRSTASRPTMNLLSPVVIVDGFVIGTWKRTLARATVAIEVMLTRELTANEHESMQAAVSTYGRFLGLEAHLRGA